MTTRTGKSPEELMAELGEVAAAFAPEVEKLAAASEVALERVADAKGEWKEAKASGDAARVTSATADLKDAAKDAKAKNVTFAAKLVEGATATGHSPKDVHAAVKSYLKAKGAVSFTCCLRVAYTPPADLTRGLPQSSLYSKRAPHGAALYTHLHDVFCETALLVPFRLTQKFPKIPTLRA